MSKQAKTWEEAIREILLEPDNWRKEVWFLEGHEVATQTLDIPKTTTLICKEVDEAEQRGIQKVVNWSNESCPHVDHFCPKRLCGRCWQAFLKDLGV